MASRTFSSVAGFPLRRKQCAATIIPGVQIPHCAPPRSRKHFCTVVNSPPWAMPSTVSTEAPSTWHTAIRQELTSSPGGAGSAGDVRSPKGGAYGGAGSAGDGRSPKGGAYGGAGSAGDGRSPKGGAYGGAGSAGDGRSPKGGAYGGAGSAGDGRSPKGGA